MKIVSLRPFSTVSFPTVSETVPPLIDLFSLTLLLPRAFFSGRFVGTSYFFSNGPSFSFLSVGSFAFTFFAFTFFAETGFSVSHFAPKEKDKS